MTHRLLISLLIVLFNSIGLSFAAETIYPLNESYYFDTLNYGNEFVLTGREKSSEENSQAHAMRISLDGSVTWQKNYGGTYTAIQHAARINDNYAAYVIQTFSSENQTLWIADMHTGDLVKQLPLPEGLLMVVEGNEDSFIAICERKNSIHASPGGLHLEKIDAQGNILAKATFSDLQNAGWYIPLAKGGYYVGTCYTNKNTSRCILRLDDNLEIIWKKVLDDPDRVTVSACLGLGNQLMIVGHIRCDGDNYGLIESYSLSGILIEEKIEAAMSSFRNIYPMNEGWGIIGRYENQGNRFIFYSNGGEEIARYDLSLKNSTISRLQHGCMIQNGGKDYLIFTTETSLHILEL